MGSLVHPATILASFVTLSLPNEVELVCFELLDVLFPELLSVARTPVQPVGVDFFEILLEGREDSVVSLKDLGEILEVAFQDFVTDVLAQFVIHDFEEVIVHHELDTWVPCCQVAEHFECHTGDLLS